MIRSRQALGLDFSTPLTVEECLDRLRSKDGLGLPSWQCLVLRHDSSFLVVSKDRLPVWVRLNKFGGYYEIRFQGTLAAVEGGTRVYGTIARQTCNRLGVEKWLFRLQVAFFAIVFLANLGVQPSGKLLVAAAFFTLWMIVFRKRYEVINRHAQRTIDQIRERLCVTPECC